MSDDVVIVSAARTPVGSFNGAFATVPAHERSAANGVTATARQAGVSTAPLLAGPLLGSAGYGGAIFVIGGGLKLLYDFALWRNFRMVKPPEEQ